MVKFSLVNNIYACCGSFCYDFFGVWTWMLISVWFQTQCICWKNLFVKIIVFSKCAFWSFDGFKFFLSVSYCGYLASNEAIWIKSWMLHVYPWELCASFLWEKPFVLPAHFCMNVWFVWMHTWDGYGQAIVCLILISVT